MFIIYSVFNVNYDRVFLYDRMAGTSQEIASNTDHASVSDGASWVGYYPSPARGYVLNDRSMAPEFVVSRAGFGLEPDDVRAYSGRMSRNGDYIVFGSPASDLVPGDTNGTVDIFLVKNPLIYD